MDLPLTFQRFFATSANRTAAAQYDALSRPAPDRIFLFGFTTIDLDPPESPTSQWGYLLIAGRDSQSLMFRARFLHLKL